MAKKKLTFQDLAARPTKFHREVVHVDEWDTDIYVRQLSGREQQTITDRTKNKKEADFDISDMAFILTLSLEDEDGGKPGGEWLAEQAFPVLNRLTQKTLEVNGLSGQAQEAIEKNS